MDRIILYFTLYHDGQWMKIYQCLEEKQKINYKEIDDIYARINCSYMSIIDECYPENFKQIHKPPFGFFYFWNQKLIEKPIITIIGNLNSCNSNKLQELAKDYVLLWINVEAKKLIEIVNTFDKNIFYYKNIYNIQILEQISKFNLKNQQNNLIISEFYKKSPENKVDEIRFYIGISKNVLIISKIDTKLEENIKLYCQKENCKFNRW